MIRTKRIRKRLSFVSFFYPLQDRVAKTWRKIGPSLITGASDDDPSGIVIYALAGAIGGYSFLWIPLLTLPLLTALEQMSSKIALVTRRGLASLLKELFSLPAVYCIGGLMFLANTINVAADLRGMSEALQLTLGLPTEVWSIMLAIGLTASLVFSSYERIIFGLKLLGISVLVYALSIFFLPIDWPAVLRATFIPNLQLSREFFLTLAAILGTTISPYLFFWQAETEIADLKGKKLAPTIKKMRTDVFWGMAFSNLIMYGILLTTGALLAPLQVRPETIGQIAGTLQPIIGPGATYLFALAVFSTGCIAIPILAGSAAYILSEIIGFPASLNKRLQEARWFYLALSGSIFLGLAISFSSIRSIDLLFYTGIIYAVLTPLLIGCLLILGNRSALMGKQTLSVLENSIGWLTCLGMIVVALLSFIL